MVPGYVPRDRRNSEKLESKVLDACLRLAVHEKVSVDDAVVDFGEMTSNN